MEENTFVEVDGFQAQEDLTHLSEHDLQHGIINRVIHLAHLRGMSIEQVLNSMLMSHVLVKAVGDLFETDPLMNDDLPVV